MKTINCLLLFLALGIYYPLSAQNGTDFPESWKTMLKLEGLWTGPCTMILPNKSYQIKYSFHFKSILDGTGMQMDENFQHAELGYFQGTNLIGYDPYEKLIHWFSVDNMGTTHDHLIRWISVNRIEVEHKSIQNGKKYTEHGFLQFNNDQTIEVHLIAKSDNKIVQELNGTLLKQKKTTMN